MPCKDGRDIRSCNAHTLACHGCDMWEDDDVALSLDSLNKGEIVALEKVLAKISPLILINLGVETSFAAAIDTSDKILTAYTKLKSELSSE